MSHDNEFGDIPPRYNDLIRQTLEDDLLVQAGRAHELKPLSYAGRLAVKAYQRAQNRATADIRKKPHGNQEEE